MSRPTFAEINLDALLANYQLACQIAPQSKTLAVVKANAYGHGAVKIAQALADHVPAFAVACIEEALELRNAGIDKPILLLEGSFCREEVDIASAHNFWLLVENADQIEYLEQASIASPIKVWLAVDTGMHRLGFQHDQLQQAYQRLSSCPQVEQPIVLSTHFASADNLDNHFTHTQIERYQELTEGLAGETSLANSAGLLAWPSAHGSWNRPGFMLYGASPFSEPQVHADQLQAVMTLKSKIISLRDIAVGETVGYSQTWQAKRPSRIATVAIGYGDGYPRNAVNGTPVVVNGYRTQLVGRVSMDMITVDVTDISDAQIGTEVELWGEQLCINEVANYSDTIGYELMTRMPDRVPRIYKKT
jgi:alanine racemase